MGVVKLQTDVRLKVAGKLDKRVWGEKSDLIGVMLDPLSEMLREISERRLKAMRELPQEGRVIEAVVEVEDDGKI